MTKWWIIFLFLPLSIYAQPDSANVVTFKVSQKKFAVTVVPDTNVLWLNVDNPLAISISDGGTVDKVMIDNGRVFRQDSLNFQAVVREGENAVISIYRKLPNGIVELAETRKYRIRRIPKPTVFVCGIKSDMVIDRRQLIDNGRITAQIDQEGFDIPLRVISFRMISYDGAEVDTMVSQNHTLTIPMRRSIHKLSPGTVLYFDQVQCIAEDGRMFMAEPSQVFVDETNKYRVGTRKLPQDPGGKPKPSP